MGDTKEKILVKALELFAREGYEAVSVSTIAGELGMVKSALYKHYKSKRDIFESILRRMEERDREKARQHQLPEEDHEKAPESYGEVRLEDIRAFTEEMFIYWTEDERAYGQIF